MEDGYGEDAVPQGPQAVVTPQFDLKVDFCRVANGRHPLRLKAQIERRKEGKREQKSGQRKESASSSLVTYRMSINEKIVS